VYGQPPTGVDWNPYQARQRGLDGVADTFEQGDWPWLMSVVYHFGTFNEAIAAAGFLPRTSGGQPGNTNASGPRKVAA